MGKRVRTHANPLKRFPDLFPPDWSAVFRDPGLPFALEIGCARGEFLLAHASAVPGMNILGVEVRKPLVADVLAEIRTRGLVNAHALLGNIAGRVREFTPGGRLDAVYIFFPDPWFKNRHHKRRIVQTGLLRECAELMPPGARIHLSTDQEPVFASFLECFAAVPDFHAIDPAPVFEHRTGWEELCLRMGRPYRKLCFSRR